MFRNYARVFSRLLVRQRGFSIINVTGLALGFACFLIITVYLTYENGFDTFHERHDDIYRISKVVQTADGSTERHALTAGLLGPALTSSFPEVEAATRVQPWFDDVLISSADRSISAPDVALVDSNFFDVLGFDLLRGNAHSALSAPLSIVLTERLARQLFGDLDPMGQSVLALNNLSYEVTGIAADPNPQSHLRFSALISWSSSLPGAGGLEFDWMNRWITQAPFTYARLIPGGNAQALEAKLPAFYEANDPERAERYTLYLQPVAETYLESSDLLYADATKRGSLRNVQTFSILRFLVLLVAAINFMNLATARGASRLKEIGIRRAMGANRDHLARQFLFESIAFSVLALVVASVLAVILLPVLGTFSGIDAFAESGISLATVSQSVLIATGLGLLAGLYPAFVLSRLRWSARSSTRSNTTSLLPRNAFVVVQFAVSMVLVAGTIVVLRQLDFLQSSDKGFNADQLVVLQTDDTAIQQQFQAFTEEVRRDPAIVSAGGSNAVPGSAISTFQVRPEGQSDDVTHIANIIRIDDFGLLDTYGFDLSAGRWFDPSIPTDTTRGIVINEALMRSLGWNDAVGRSMDIVGELNEGTILGVVSDFQFQSAHQTVAPLAFYFAPRGGSLTVRVSQAAVSDALNHLEETWKAFESRYPFSYTFLDESFARFYVIEQRLMKLMSLFSVLALFVACLGLYGLAAYMTSIRTPEIGLRKVLGATVPQIVFLFVSGLVRLVGVAVLIGTPIVYLGATSWLENFAFKVPLGVDVFLIAAAVILGVALLSACLQPVRAALINPAAALRHE